MGEMEKKSYRGVVKSMKRRKWVGILLLICIAVGFLGGWKTHKAYYDRKFQEEEVTVSYVTGKLEDIGELATKQLTYTSRIPIEDGSIPVLTKKGFTMQYNATLKAGVDMREMEVKKSGKTYVIRIPHAKLLGPAHVDPDSVQFFDEKKAIFNWKQPEDVTKAISIAEKDIAENPNVDTSTLLEQADENTEQLIHKILDDSVGDMEIRVEFREQ